jgi:vitamin B12 transporter
LPLNYRADETATLEISAPLAGWQLGGQWRAVGERYYYSGAARLRGYGLLNMYASRAIAPGWTLQTRVNNAHDREYDGDGYYATPGRVWFVGLKWQER